MGLKKKSGELFHRVEDSVVVTRISKGASRASLINVLKERGLEILYVFALFLFTTGIVNGLIEGSRPALQNQMVYPQRGLQTIPESLIYFVILSTGSAGIYLLYMGGRHTLKRRISDFYIILGFSAVLLALALSLYVFEVKM